MTVCLAPIVASFGHLFGPDLIVLPIILFCLVFPIWMVIDCIQRESSQGNDKIVWLLVILLVPLGSIVYFFARKLSRDAQRQGPPQIP